MNTQATRSALLLLTAGSAALLAGCGGGGSNGNSGTGGTTGTSTGTTGTTGTSTGTTGTAQISGKVTDAVGNGVPGVSVAVDTGGQITNTISTGGYRLNNLSAGVHTITVSQTVSGVQYTGSTQVAAISNALVSNANIILSRVGQQATVKGYVHDTSGNALAGASVYLAVPNVATASSSGNYSSLTAFTDSTGFYQISHVPTTLQTGSLLMTAADVTTAAAYQNQNATLAQTALTVGAVVTQNFTLSASTSTAADVPVVVGINSFTQPIDGLTGDALRARIASGSLASGSVYETLRRQLSPTYAAFAARRRSAGKRLAARAVSAGYAVETDLAFNPPAATDTSLLGYNIYRTTGAVATNTPQESTADLYDSLLDPLANYYTDLTATTDQSGSPYTATTAYNFALSAFSAVAPTVPNGQTSTSESVISAPITITPLGPLTLNAPLASTTVTSPVTVSWTPVAGATKYYVYVYTQYPGAGSNPLFTPTALPAGTSGASVTLTGGGVTYYVIVVAAADETELTGATTPTINAAQSYSEITAFTVQ